MTGPINAIVSLRANNLHGPGTARVSTWKGDEGRNYLYDKCVNGRSASRRGSLGGTRPAVEPDITSVKAF